MAKVTCDKQAMISKHLGLMPTKPDISLKPLFSNLSLSLEKGYIFFPEFL